MANIGENVAKISDTTRKKYQFVEWQQIKSFRNNVVHHYIGINIEIAFNIIKYDLKYLKQNIEKIIRENLSSGVFMVEEIDICKKSSYYKHIEFRLLQ